jgi:tetratricopeptide (TPR) repeat protein
MNDEELSSNSLIIRYGLEEPLSDNELGVLNYLQGVQTLQGLVVVKRGLNHFIVDFGEFAKVNGQYFERSGLELYRAQNQLASGCLQLALRHYMHIEGSTTLSSLNCAHSLAMSFRLNGEFDEARELLTELLELMRLRLGETDTSTLETLNDLAVLLLDSDRAVEAIELLSPAIDTCIELNGVEHRQTLTLKSNLADGQRMIGNFVVAQQLDEEVLCVRRANLGEGDPETLVSMNNLAYDCLLLGLLTQARSLQEEVLKRREMVLPPDDIDTITAKANLAVTLYRLGEWTEALRFERQVLADRERVQGIDHPDTWTAKNNLAGTLRDIGDLSEAKDLLTETLNQRKTSLGEEHNETLMAQVNLADILCKAGQLEEALKLAESAWFLRQKYHGNDHPETLTAIASLAAIRLAMGEFEVARKLQELAFKERMRFLGPDHYDTLLAQNDLATLLDKAGETASARDIYVEVLERSEMEFGLRHPDSLAARINLADAQYRLKDKQPAILHAMLVAETLADRLMLYGDDYKLAERTFALLQNLDIVQPLRILFPKVSALMCMTMELRTRDSMLQLINHFRVFHENWLAYCLRHAIEDIPLALIATQGLEAGAEFNDVLMQTTKDAQSPSQDSVLKEAVKAARATLSDVRARIEETDALLASLNYQLQNLPQASLGLAFSHEIVVKEREMLLKSEQKAVRRYEDAKDELARLEPELLAILRAPRQTATQLASQLEPYEVLVLIWQNGEQCVATIITSKHQYTLVLVRLNQLLKMVVLYERQIAVTGRAWRIVLETECLDDQKDQSDVNAAIPSIYDLATFCEQAFWLPLLEQCPTANRFLVVVDSNLHAAPLEAGNPGVEARYFTGLPSFHRVWLASDAPILPSHSMTIVIDQAWCTPQPIPFVALEAEIVAELAINCKIIEGANFQDLDQQMGGSRLLIACHGMLRGLSSRRYPVLMIDSLKGKTLDPSQLRRMASQINEFYCSACVGGIVSQAAGGDALGIVSALQLRGVRVIVASAAPLPDFYMPIFSALYWFARLADLSAHDALLRAKNQLRSGDWPVELIESIQNLYHKRISKILDCFQPQSSRILGSNNSYLDLVSCLAGWLWPPELIGEGQKMPLLRNRDECAALSRKICSTREQSDQSASLIAAHLIAQRHDYPRDIIEHICAFIVCYG